MEFKDFINEGKARKSSQDISLAKSLLKTAKIDLKFLEDLQINAHETFTYYLKEKNKELLFQKFDRFKKIRNSINYYGTDISVEETKENIAEIKKIINELIDKYLGDLNNE